MGTEERCPLVDGGTFTSSGRGAGQAPYRWTAEEWSRWRSFGSAVFVAAGVLGR